MNDTPHWTVPKWPFLLGDAALLALAFYLVWRVPHPLSGGEAGLAAACVALGAGLGCLPFILDYRAVVKAIDAAALGAVAGKIQNLEKLAGRIAAATDEWLNVQTQAEKISTSANEIAARMAAEVREFSEFMQKINDGEKAALRLEVEKWRRSETEWLQTLVRILDHVFALHSAAMRSGQPRLAEQISHFQNACRDAARRIGLTPFTAEPDEPFDAARHQLPDGSARPPAGAVVAETAAPGFTFRGCLLRPALVRLRETISAPEAVAEQPAAKDPSPLQSNRPTLPPEQSNK